MKQVNKRHKGRFPSGRLQAFDSKGFNGGQTTLLAWDKIRLIMSILVILFQRELFVTMKINLVNLSMSATFSLRGSFHVALVGVDRVKNM